MFPLININHFEGKLRKRNKSDKLLCRVEMKSLNYENRTFKKRFIRLEGNTLYVHNSNDPMDTSITTSIEVSAKTTQISWTPWSKENRDAFPTKYPFTVLTSSTKITFCADDNKTRYLTLILKLTFTNFNLLISMFTLLKLIFTHFNLLTLVSLLKLIFTNFKLIIRQVDIQQLFINNTDLIINN
jgi:hypothetical protein